jgi:endo-1,4-beta-xylanase
MAFIPVTDITNFRSAEAIVGEEIELLADVVPGNATNRTIEWSIISGDGTIRRSGNRSFLTPTSTQRIAVRATIRHGLVQQ